ncbi:hypothetical protein CSA56_11660 [candidate division KSB3 bacterium]|uniref:PKD/Chitinase domain-containing protein n=1 Tax=candidate division KSB3 bacterium TaxID=2044937 RepID=A0A2G6KCM9_9BACT|nr:MAG: hypothetical protein CSA56_11660 [candidate division KSB3 bacterium]
MMTQIKQFSILAGLLGLTLMFVGCSDSDSPTNTTQNEFPTVQGILIEPNAAVYVDDTITLSPQTDDPDDDHIRYVWSKTGGTFDPVEAVGPSIQWTAPGVQGTYQIVVIGDDGNGGTSTKHLDINTYGGDQSGTVDMVGGVQLNPIGGNAILGHIDAGDTLVLVWDGASPVTADSTRPDETKYAPNGARLDAATLTVVSPPQFGSAAGLPLVNAARYALIAKIGSDGGWFELTPGPDADSNGIPDYFTAVAPTRGKVYLGMNEQEDLLQDNTGYWRFSFTMTH